MCYLIIIFVEKLRIACVLVDRSIVDETGCFQYCATIDKKNLQYNLSLELTNCFKAGHDIYTYLHFQKKFS